MSLDHKYYLSLAGFIVGSLLVVSGSNELRTSFGDPQSIRRGLWQLIPGVILVIVVGPAFYYFRARRRIPKPNLEIEVETLAQTQQLKNNQNYRKK